MTTEQWYQVTEIFESALEREESHRLSFIAEASAGDEILREAAERMLCDWEQAGDFLESPALVEAGLVAPDFDPGEVAGRRIGPYKIIGEIGRGGMSVVYLAERADEVYDKRVAIKLVWVGAEGTEIAERFQRERRILAQLEHPHIARLLDGGVTEEGWQYVVMEYVDGAPITEYCDQQRLPLKERLKLFQEICDVVQYAHQNLVVHRDLKPSNILVTKNAKGEGAVKLLDFGIAKILDQGLEGAGAAQPPTVLNFLTPEYASPEQLRGERVTTASDVYSLGVLLYELLTGRRPFESKSRSPQELIRLIEEREPAKPSLVVESRRYGTGSGSDLADSIALKVEPGRYRSLYRTIFPPEGGTTNKRGDEAKLRGDLDNIILKALQKEPQRRYQSPRQLSEDIARHLSGEPVSAREATLAYRLGKRIRRNKALTAGLAVLVLALIVGLIVSRQQLRASRAREREQRRQLYAADMRRAGQELNEGNLSRVRELIENYLPASRARMEQDWRGFEWYLLWHAAHNGQTLLRHPGYDFNGDITPDGRRLFVRSRDGKIATYDLSTGRVEEVFSDQQDWIAQLDVSRDGKWLAAGGRTTGVARVWDIATRRLLIEIKAHDESINTIALSPDGKLLATGSIDATARIWDVATGQLLHLAQRENWVRHIAFSPDGRILAIVNVKSPYPRGVLTLLNTRNFQQTGSVDLSSALQHFSFSPDGALLAGAPRDGIVRVWEVKSQRLVYEFASHNDIVWSVAFSPDGSLLASRGNDGKLGLWDLSTGVGIARSFSDAEILAIAFLPQRAPDYRIVTSEFGGTTLWEVNKLTQPAAVNQAPSDVNSVAVSPNGRLIASTGGSRTKVWRLPELEEFGAYQKNIQHLGVLFSPDGRWLATVGGKSGADAANSSFVDLRDLGAGGIVNSWGGHSKQVFGAAFSPDGQWLATAEDQTIKLWDAPSGRERLTINAHDFLALAVDVSPDGQRLVSGGYDARAKVWDATTGRELFRLAGHTYPVNTVKFSPDGKLIATGGSDHLVKLWDAETGREISTLVGHARNVTSVAFSPDGKRLASASQDRAIRIWEVETGVELMTLKGHTDFVSSLAFSPDGALLISGGRDQTVRLWRAATEEEVQARREGFPQR